MLGTVVAALSLVHCGGDDTAAAGGSGGTGTGGSGGTGTGGSGGTGTGGSGGTAPTGTCTSVTITSPTPRNSKVHTTQACSGCDDQGVSTITFTFAEAHPCGRFVDGSPWVLDEGQGVRIVQIEPPVTDDCGASVCNGWMLNPSAPTQAFDARMSYDDTAAPAVQNPSTSQPLEVSGGTSIIKSVSFQDEIVGSGCDDQTVFGSGVRNCLYFYGVLSVLGEAPPDGTGAGYFRPPYVGTDKPLIPISDVDQTLLPKLPTSAVTDDLPDLQAAEDTLCTVVVDFMGTYSNQFFKGFLDTGEVPSAYQGYVSRHVGDYLLRALHEDRSERLVHCIVQRGIDMFHMLRPPMKTSWDGNGGHGQGRTAWPYLAAALLGRADWASEMSAMDAGRFAERSQVYWSPVADPNGDYGGGPGEVLYGSYPGRGGAFTCTVTGYWDNCFVPGWPGSGCNRVCADPFGFIDGGTPGDSYQQIYSPSARAFALAARLVPALGALWPQDDGHKLFLEYIDRWVDFGGWALPDPCDANASQPASNSPANCTSSDPGTCICNKGSTPRYPGQHGANADGGVYGTAYTPAMWSAYRACATDCSCPGMTGLCN